MASAARTDRAAPTRHRAGGGVLVMALAAFAAAVLTCWPATSAPPQVVSLSPVSSAASVPQAADYRPADAPGTTAGTRGAAEPLDHCAPCPTDHHGTHCSPHLPDGNLNSASPTAPSVDDESGPHAAPRRAGAPYGAANPPVRAPDLHFLQLLRV